MYLLKKEEGSTNVDYHVNTTVSHIIAIIFGYQNYYETICII